MESDTDEMVNEIRNKVILHWNCRELVEFPEIIREYGSHIQEIYLKWNKLTNLPPWIIELFNVTNLYIYGNLIKELPPEFGGMGRLTVLDLSANRLEEIPSCLGSLTNLKCLLLNNNFIKLLPLEMEQLCNLETFSISDNKLLVLPGWIGSLPKLRELNVDRNRLRELPNRLTISRKLSIVSVCSNRLKFLPMNAFVSCPTLRFQGNININYLSYPILFQLIFHSRNTFVHATRNNFERSGTNGKTNGNDHPKESINLSVKTSAADGKFADPIIELPRQLLTVHSVYDNVTVSLWESALRTVYSQRYRHTLNVSSSPVNVAITYEPMRNVQTSEQLVRHINYASYNLLMNGPVGICVSPHCQKAIFTEAWVVAGLSHFGDPITTIALCCCQR